MRSCGKEWEGGEIWGDCTHLLDGRDGEDRDHGVADRVEVGARRLLVGGGAELVAEELRAEHGGGGEEVVRKG